MSSKISQLKFVAHKFERVQWSRIKPFENSSWFRAPNFHIRSSGGSISPLLVSIICTLRHQRDSKCSIAPSRAQISVFPIRSFSLPHSVPIALLRVSNFLITLPPPHSFPIAFLRGSNFPMHCIKGPKIFHCAIKGPNFLIMSSK